MSVTVLDPGFLPALERLHAENDIATVSTALAAMTPAAGYETAIRDLLSQAITDNGEAGLAVAAVFVAIMMPTANVLSVAALVKYGAAGRASWWGVVVGITKNPLILACIAGAALNPFASWVPDWTIGVLGILAPTALPIALLCVGAGLVFSALRSRHWIVTATSVYKLALLPLIAWGIVEVLGLPPLASAVVVLFAATPVSPSTYVLARQMGGDADLMAGIITAQTALSMISISAVLILIGDAAAG